MLSEEPPDAAGGKNEMLWVHRSNRLEELVEVLLQYLSEDRPHPQKKQPIVVQGAGMDRYLLQRLASHFGIWANASFPFPRKFFEDLFARADIPPPDPFDPYQVESLTWSIAQLLPELLTRPEFEPLAVYTTSLARVRGHDFQRGLTRDQVALAYHLAELFDRYVVYRADELHAWDRASGDGDWQAELWRALVRHIGAPHFAARAKRWVEMLEVIRASLPARVYFFGLLHLPPLYLELLGELAVHSEVHLFLLNPSPEYWAWIRTRRSVLRQEWERFGSVQQLEQAWQEALGNPLLASLGRMGGELQAVLEGTVDYAESDHYEPPAEDSLLHVLQADIFALRRRTPDQPDALPLVLREEDDSLRIHSCHSPMREVEVLHDALRDALERDSSLQPEDCLVLCTDLTTYAPLIHAVFGNPSLGRRAIPYQIADLPVRDTEELVSAFFAALELLRSRARSSEILAFLARPPVRKQFGISLEQIDRLRKWIEETNVHWGWDASHRAEEGLPALSEHTWEFGLNRLLLGAALPFDEDGVLYGVRPYGDAEGQGAELAGQLAEFLRRLHGLHTEAGHFKTVEQWVSFLDRARVELFSPDEPFTNQHRALRGALRELRERAQQARFTRRVELEAVSDRLAALLEEPGRPYGFLAGGVNVCALRSTRCIPARVVALLGMSEEAYPRKETPLPIDRMVQAPRPADPHPREEDRYAFLLALLSARDRLLITYPGQDIRNNATRLPATVVSELLDTVDESFVCSQPDRLPRELVVVRHRLHAFAPQYFRDPEGPFFSFSPSLSQAAARMLAPRRPPPRWFSREIEPWPDRSIELDALLAFYKHPQREFLRTRFGIRAGEFELPDLDEEPLELNGLRAWQLGTFLLDCRLRGMPATETRTCARATGLLPPGRLGDFAFEKIAAEVESLVASVQAYGGEVRGEPVSVRARFASLPGWESFDSQTVGNSPHDGWEIGGQLRHFGDGRQVLYTFSQIERGEELRAWLMHLILNSLDDPSLPRETVLIGRSRRNEDERPAVVQFPPLAEAKEYLASLLSWFLLGLRAPLPFVPEASRAYAEAIWRRKEPAEATRAAQSKIVPRDGSGRPRRDPAFVLLYGKLVPRVHDLNTLRPAASPSFGELALRIFHPLWNHSNGESGP